MADIEKITANGTTYDVADATARETIGDTDISGIGDGTLTGAVDELNTKSMKAVTATGTDLNDYTETGVYYFANTVTPTNIPAGNNGILLVYQCAENIVKQIWLRIGTVGTNDYNTFVRTYIGQWGDWQRFVIQSELSSYVDKSGDTMTGNLIVSCSSSTASLIRTTNSYGSVDMEISGSGNRGIYDTQAGTWTIYRAQSDNKTTVGDSGTVTNITGSTVQINGTAISSLFSIGSFDVDNQTISASSIQQVTCSVSRSGYTPLGIVGYNITNASTSGVNSSWCIPYGVYLNGTSAVMNIRNNYTSAAIVRPYWYVLYMAS